MTTIQGEGFATVLASILDTAEVCEVVSVQLDILGPLGGVSQQVKVWYTDETGERHPVILNAYVDIDPKVMEDSTRDWTRAARVPVGS